jgi:hypothetical protein
MLVINFGCSTPSSGQLVIAVVLAVAVFPGSRACHHRLQVDRTQQSERNRRMSSDVDKVTKSDQRGVSDELAARRTGMSFQRTRMSADRTLMSVIRTSLSLISFGFTIFQVFERLRESKRVESDSHGISGLRWSRSASRCW